MLIRAAATTWSLSWVVKLKTNKLTTTTTNCVNFFQMGHSWDSSPGKQNGRHRRIHWVMVASPVSKFTKHWKRQLCTKPEVYTPLKSRTPFVLRWNGPRRLLGHSGPRIGRLRPCDGLPLRLQRTTFKRSSSRDRCEDTNYLLSFLVLSYMKD